MAAVAKLQGQRALMRKLSTLERQLAPRAMAGALNRTATKARQQVVSDARQANPGRKAKDLRRWVRVAQRAKAPDRLAAMLARDTPPTSAPARRGRTSAPFRVDALSGKTFVRDENGKRRSRGRPQSSPPNLPIYRVGPRSRDVRRVLQRSLFKAAQQQMTTFLPGEFRRQLARQVSRIQARGR